MQLTQPPQQAVTSLVSQVGGTLKRQTQPTSRADGPARHQLLSNIRWLVIRPQRGRGPAARSRYLAQVGR